MDLLKRILQRRADDDVFLKTFEGIFEQLTDQMCTKGVVSIDVLTHVKRCLLSDDPATRETAARHIFELFAPPFSSDPSESNSSSIISRLLQPTAPVASQPSAGRRNSLLSPLVPTNEPLPAQPLDGDEIGLMLVAAFCEAAYYDVQWAKVCLKLIERIAEVCALDRTWKQLLQLYRSAEHGPAFGVELLSSVSVILRASQPDAFFCLDNLPLCLSLPHCNIGQRHYSIVTWVRLDAESADRQTLCACLSNNGAGIQIFIEDRRLSLRCVPSASNDLIVFEDFQMDLNRWYCVTLVHNKTHSTNNMVSPAPTNSSNRAPVISERGVVSLYVDGLFWQTIDIEFPQWDQTYSGMTCTLGAFRGHLGPFYMFHENLTTKQVQLIAGASAHQLQPSHSFQFTSVPAVFAASAGPASNQIPRTASVIAPNRLLSPSNQNASSSQSNDLPVQIERVPVYGDAWTTFNIVGAGSGSGGRLALRCLLALRASTATPKHILIEAWDGVGRPLSHISSETHTLNQLHSLRLPTQRNRLVQWGGAFNALMMLSPAYRGKLPNTTPSFQTDAELCAALQLLQTIIVDHPPCLAQLFGSVTSTVAGKETDVPPGITQGLASIRVLLLDRAPPSCRTTALVHVLYSFIVALEHLSLDPSRLLSSEASRILLFDMSFWALSSPATKLCVCETLNMVIREKPDLIRPWMTVALLSDALHWMCPDDFNTSLVLPAPTSEHEIEPVAVSDEPSSQEASAEPNQESDESKNSTEPSADHVDTVDVSVDYIDQCVNRLFSLIEFIVQTPYFAHAHSFLLPKSSTLQPVHFDWLCHLVEDCRSTRVLDRALPCLLVCAKHHPAAFFGYLHSPQGDFRSFMGGLRSECESTRLCALRIIGYYLTCSDVSNITEDALNECSSLSQHLATALARLLAVFPFTIATYQCLLQLALGAPLLSLDEEVVLDDTKVLKHPQFLGCAFELLHGASVALQQHQFHHCDRDDIDVAEASEQFQSKWLQHLQLRQAMVLDLLTMLHLHADNPKALVCDEEGQTSSMWQRWLIPLTHCTEYQYHNEHIQSVIDQVLNDELQSPVHNIHPDGLFQSPVGAASFLVYGSDKQSNGNGAGETDVPVQVAVVAPPEQKKYKKAPTVQEGIASLHEIINQQISSICAILLHHAVKTLDQGWMSTDFLLWHSRFHHAYPPIDTQCNNFMSETAAVKLIIALSSVQSKALKMNTRFRLEMSIHLAALSKTLRDSTNPSQLWQSNMPPTLQLLEHHLFVHPESCFSSHFSPSSAPSLIELAQHIASSMVYCQHPSFDELTALERFLHASQLLFAAETRRSDIIRISFRFLRHVLPHVWLPCSIATKLLSTLGKIFINGTCLGQRHARNVKLIRLVLYLLHQTRCLWVLKLGGPAVFASDSLSNPDLYGCIVQISSLMCDLYDFWGVEELFGADAAKMLEQEKSNVGTQSLRRLNFVDDDVLYLFFALYPPFPHHSFHQQKQQQSQFSLEFGDDSAWHERANEQNARAAELQTMLDTLYQHEAKFAEMLQQRHDRIDSMMRVSFCEQKPENDQKRVKALAQTVVAKKLSTENRIVTFTNMWYRLPNNLTALELQRLEDARRMLKPFQRQYDTSNALTVESRQPWADLRFFLLQSEHGGVELDSDALVDMLRSYEKQQHLHREEDKKLYWKLDRTETSQRMRRLFRRNFKGHDHQQPKLKHHARAEQNKVKESIELTKILSKEALKLDMHHGADNVDDVNDDEFILPNQKKVRPSLVVQTADNVSATGPRSSVLQSGQSSASTTSSQSFAEFFNDGNESISSTGNSVNAVDKPVDKAPAAGPNVSSTPTPANRSTLNGALLNNIAATMIAPSRKSAGELHVSKSQLLFVGTAMNEEHLMAHTTQSSETSKQGVDTSSQLLPELPRAQKNLTWTIRSIQQVLPRRYLLRSVALEVFFRTHTNILLVFETYEQRNRVYRLLCDLCDLPFELSARRRMRLSGLTAQWQQRKLTNFEYLMHINTIAGRSYNDITQYPVFPWVLADYTSSSIDLNDPKVYRDLSKPMGALSPARAEMAADRYDALCNAGNVVEFEQPSDSEPQLPPFHFGSHYSSAGIALQYLLRVEPFTSMSVTLQGGSFDLPDRLFHSIAGLWEMATADNNLSDVRELIPEMFYLPECLTNTNNIKFGSRSDGLVVDDVVLPPWAKNSPETFIRMQREALESDYVTANLPKWIDLIFGYKQRGQEAVNSLNVFFHLTYEDALDLDQIENVALREAYQAQIYHFGQTPSQLFVRPHPGRLPLAQCAPGAGIALPVLLPTMYRSIQCLPACVAVRKPALPGVASPSAESSGIFSKIARRLSQQTTSTMLPITEFETVPGQSMLKGRIVQVAFSKPHAVRGFATSATLLNGRDVSADAFPASFDSEQTPPSEHVDLITVITDQYEMQTVSISHFMQRYHDFQVSEDVDESDRRYVQSAPIFYPLFVSRPRTGDDFVHAASQAVADVANNCHDADTDFTMIAQSELNGFSTISMPSMVRVHQSLQLLQNTHRRLKRTHERELKQNQENALNSAWWSQDNGGAAVAAAADTSSNKTLTNEKKDLSTFFDRLMTSDQQPMKTAHNLLDNAFDSDAVSQSPQQLSGSSNALLPIEDLKLSLRQMRSGSVQSACSTDSNSQPASLEASFDSSHPDTPQPSKFDPFAEMFATPAPTTAVKAERKLDELDSVDDVDRLRLLLRLRAAVADTMPAVDSDEQQDDDGDKGNDAGDGKCVISAPQAARVLYTADSKQAEVWLPLEQHTGQAYAPLQLMCEHWRQNIPVDRLLVVAAGGRFVLSAGYADTSIKAHSVATGQCVGSNAKAHLGAAITCLSLAADQPTTLLSGAADGSLSFWSLNLLDSSNANMLPPAVASSTAAPWLLNPLPEKATLSLCIHQSAVRDCAAHHALGLAVSVANAGYSTEFALYSLRRRRFLRSFSVPSSQPCPFRGLNPREAVAVDRVMLSPLGYIITMGLNKRGESVLWLLTVNGKLLLERRLNKQAERTMQLDVAFENQLDSEIGYNLDLDINYVDECNAESSVNNSHSLLYVSRAGDLVFTSCGHFVSVRCAHTLQPIQVFDCQSADVSAVITSIDLTTDEKVMSVAMSDGTVLLFPLPHWARHTAGGRDRLEFRLHRLHELEQQAVQEKLALEQEQLQRAQPQQDPVVVSHVAEKTESSLFDAFKKRFF